MNDSIRTFIQKQKNFTLCTAVNNVPYCASCFYAFLNDNNYLVFSSKKESKHIADALLNNMVAGTIIPDISKLGLIKGIQFSGNFIILSGYMLERAKEAYYLKFPFSITMNVELWAIELLYIKMTDNKLGFGKKLEWKISPQ